jgi:hypothetical protein
LLRALRDLADALSCHVGDCPTCQSALEGLTGGGVSRPRPETVSASRASFLERLKSVPVSLSGRLGGRGRPAFLANGALIRGGTLSLRLAGTQKVLEGVTTPEEILRTTVED